MKNEDDLLVRIGLTEKQYLATIKRLEAQTTRAAKGMENSLKRSNKSFVQGTANLNRAARNSGQSLRQVSMQLSQVAQQGAVTGNYMQALSIQAADIGLAFGTAGIAIGSIIPVLYGVVEGALGVKDGFAELDEKIMSTYSSVTSALDAAKEAQDRYTAAVTLTGQTQGLVTSGVLESLKLEATAREALAALELAKLETQKKALSDALAKNKAELDEILETAKLAGTVGTFNKTDEQIAARVAKFVEAARRDNEELVLKVKEQRAELDLVNALMAQNNGEASEFIDSLVDASKAAINVADATGQIDFSDAISGARSLASELDISLHKALQVMGVLGAAAQAARDKQNPILDPRDPRAERPIFSGETNFEKRYTPPKATSSRSSRGGGSSRGRTETDKTATELERLQQSLASAEQLEMESFDRQQETLQAALEKKLLTQQEYASLMEEAQRQHSSKMAEIDVYRYGTGLQQTQAFMGQMAAALKGGNDKLLRIGKAFAEAQALIDAYSAYNRTLADPSLPWFARIPAAASVLSAGLGAVNAIKGASTGGASAAAASTASTEAAAQTSGNVLIQLEGETFSRDSVNKLIDMLNDAQDGGKRLRIV